jgi:hypothetical protein
MPAIASTSRDLQYPASYVLYKHKVGKKRARAALHSELCALPISAVRFQNRESDEKNKEIVGGPDRVQLFLIRLCLTQTFSQVVE